MTDLDADRTARIIAAAGSQSLDLIVYSIIAAVRAEAVVSEREREVARLEALAREALLRGDLEVAHALAGAADGLVLRAPKPADVADA